MDEQTTPAQASNYDISADGAAVPGYSEEPLQAMPEEPPTTTPENDEILPSDGVSLDENGELNVGNEFFGDMPDSPGETQPEAPAPNWYTEEELDSIPFQQWDMSRLNGDIPVSKIAPIVQRQLQRTQAQANARKYENTPLPDNFAEVKQYTPKELAQEAIKLACENLGIGDVDDFDSYEAEHRAAYELASQELRHRRNAEIAAYQTAVQTWNENNRYQAELAQRPDFREFNQWAEEQFRMRGTTLAQVNLGLYNMARQNGNNFRIVPEFIEGLYREFRQAKQSARPKPANQGIRQIPRRPAPAPLESSQGSTYTGKPPFSAKDFGRMDEDQQADALMKLGLV